MAFSTAVKLGDLNDFIAPSQACVVSLQKSSEDRPAPPVSQEHQNGLHLNQRSSRRAAAAANGSADSSKTGFKQTTVDADTQAVKVSLADCLACSGCVTSAETVLLQHQSLQEFVAKCEDPDAVVVVSISPQSRASLAALHGISPAEVHSRLANFFKHRLSVALVVDISLGHALALTEAAVEFVHRYRETRQHQSQAAGAIGADNTSQAAASSSLPLLASACPGWVCYAEKTHGSFILPHIATTRSPQGVMGALVKRLLAPQNGWDPRSIYHVTVMPCYDKKLEASREDFALPGLSVPEVDSSLTTGEVQQLLEKFGYGKLADAASGRADNLLQLLQQSYIKQQQQGQQQQRQLGSTRLPEPCMHSQFGSSGGYAQHIFLAAAQQLFGVQLAAHGQRQLQQPLPFKILRNADFQELQLLNQDGQPLLRFATAYGFRNIQTLVRKIKSGQCEYDYVEVMACPSGCLNGGGQLKPAAGQSAAAWIEQVELLFLQQQALSNSIGSGSAHEEGQQQQKPQYTMEPGVVQLHSEHPGQQPFSSSSCGYAGDVSTHTADSSSSRSDWSWALPADVSVAGIEVMYSVLLGGNPGSATVKPLLHTQYHKREKSITSTISDW